MPNKRFFASPFQVGRGPEDGVKRQISENIRSLESWLKRHEKRESMQRVDSVASFTNTVINTYEEINRVTYNWEDPDRDLWPHISYDLSASATGNLSNTLSASVLNGRLLIEYSVDGGSTWTTGDYSRDGGITSTVIYGNVQPLAGGSNLQPSGDLIVRTMGMVNNLNLEWDRVVLVTHLNGDY